MLTKTPDNGPCCMGDRLKIFIENTDYEMLTTKILTIRMLTIKMLTMSIAAWVTHVAQPGVQMLMQ